MPVQIVVFLAGLALIAATLMSAVKTVILPRGVPSFLTRYTFRSTRRVFDVIAHPSRSFEWRDRVMAMYSPVTLILLPAIWVFLVGAGYAALFWAVGFGTVEQSSFVSGSSLLTLGFVSVEGWAQHALAFSEATLGLGLVALLITFLPAMYSSFADRETMVALLDVRAGTPPSAVEFLLRYHRIDGFEELPDAWKDWERFFAQIQESHTSYPALVFLRSPLPEMHWITAAGTMLDAAALYVSTCRSEPDPQAQVMLRAGFLSLRRICDFFGIEYPADPAPTDPIAITKDEFLTASEQLRSGGVSVSGDLEQAWRDYAGWRVNYDTPLLRLANITMAPIAPWSSDRSAPGHTKPVIRRWGRNRTSV